jgi:ribonuclease HII
VVAAAVILPAEPQDWISEVRDSKKLSAKKREELADLITEHCIWSIEGTPAYKIDDMNILQATLWTMKKAIYALSVTPDLVLVDGPHSIPDLGLPQEAIKNGDNIHKAIAAASILAKVNRDAHMQAMHPLHPMYGWDKNKGYGTQEHREAIMVYGPCPLHRFTFRGVSEYVKGEETF